MIFLKRISVLFAALILFTNYSLATAPTIEQTIDVVETQPLTIQEKIVLYANKHNSNAVIISNIIKCESSYNPQAVGDNGNSFGLSQIHLPSHPDISKEQALDEDFAIEFMAKNINTNPYMWSCYRIVYG